LKMANDLRKPGRSGLAHVLGLDAARNEHWLQPRLLKNSGPAWCRNILLGFAHGHQLKISSHRQPRADPPNVLTLISSGRRRVQRDGGE
jgi:hypothetical protein